MKQQAIQLLVTFFCIVLAILLFIAVFSVAGNLKLLSIRKKRKGKGFTREHFIASFRTFGVPDTIPATVFDYYTARGIWKDFPLSPDDTYSQVLWDDPDDIDEDAFALVERLQMRFLPEYILREYGDKPLVTLRDMVLWLDWIRQHQSPSAVLARQVSGFPTTRPSDRRHGYVRRGAKDYFRSRRQTGHYAKQDHLSAARRKLSHVYSKCSGRTSARTGTNSHRMFSLSISSIPGNI